MNEIENYHYFELNVDNGDYGKISAIERFVQKKIGVAISRELIYWKDAPLSLYSITGSLSFLSARIILFLFQHQPAWIPQLQKFYEQHQFITRDMQPFIFQISLFR